MLSSAAVPVCAKGFPGEAVIAFESDSLPLHSEDEKELRWCLGQGRGA